MQVLSLNEIEQVNGGMRTASDYAVMAVGIVVVGGVCAGAATLGSAAIPLVMAKGTAELFFAGTVGKTTIAVASGMTAIIARDAYTDVVDYASSYLFA
ncbi:hypothetical protein [Shewanella surugensis]|uniref:Class IIb bacteriocin, lactobin A/cerein 7B family n=1 Tax=Shewanella surugensis TaxID=212020 RepID=A0ABT0LE37_9GAMM|nr:hypothetical protein [Shewanella surugensis]MCL1125966.1 hypothetical protein [Shewanella surugensis]